MTKIVRFSLPAALFVAFALSYGHASAQSATSATPSPSPSPTPSTPSDPCGSILSIVTRPTVTTGVCTVRSHRALLETGYTNSTITGSAGGETAQYPQAFLRLGTGDPHLEFSFSPPSSNVTSVGGATVGGTSDMNAGVKYELGYNDKAVWGVNAQVSVPSGSHAFTAGVPQYVGNFNWSYTLNSEFSLAGTLGFNSLAGYTPSEQVQRYFAFIPSVELEASLPANSQLFIEYAYFSQAGAGVGSRSLIDAGYQKDLSAHVQFDVEYGVQPTTLGGQRLHYIGAGLSFMN
jgi:opacity protein-like surface antigen